MDIRKIDEDYSVLPQIEAEDVDIVSLLGFRSIVCHQPDCEQADQPEFSSIADRAAWLGIAVAVLSPMAKRRAAARQEYPASTIATTRSRISRECNLPMKHLSQGGNLEIH
ncbi:TIGR01244 family phosphatase [Metarhizobium album]|uniref:TIGR01244 family phosphatase n=1 Tax=Metarhizobium album TaxID=2182425 RepID=A0A2U2DMT4_9HYPH|nr:TIGR01244 family phosphatase [Rhizobium album]